MRANKNPGLAPEVFRFTTVDDTIVAFAPAFHRGKRCRERAGDQRRRYPERHLGGGLARLIRRGLRIRDRLINALLGFLLRQPGACGNQLRDAGTIARGEVRAGS